MLELEGTTLGHYQLQRRLAQGGMSIVYLATDQRLERTVALKVVERSRDEDMKQFQCEVKALGLLRHPHILTTFDSGEDGPYCYIAMPYIAGGTLRERLTKGPLNLQAAGIILAQVASALQCMHDHGLVHCDIKPGNILLHSEQYIYLADFGLAKEAAAYSDTLQTGLLVGTPEYLAPELAEEPAGPGSDIYALGIVLYQMLTGKLPFKGSTPIVVCLKHLNEQPVAPSLLNPAIPSAIEQVILCALEKDPRRRFPTVKAMTQAYQRALQAATSGHTIPIQHALPTLHYRARLKTVPPPAREVLSLRTLHRRQGHPAVVGLVATLFFAIAISLGTLASGLVTGGLRAQLAPALNANAMFAQTQGTAQQALPHVGFTPTPTPPKTSPSSDIDSSKQSNGLSARPYGNKSGSSYSKVSGSGSHGHGQSTGSGSASGSGQSGGHKKGSGGGNGHGNGGGHKKGSGGGNGHGKGHGNGGGHKKESGGGSGHGNGDGGGHKKGSGGGNGHGKGSGHAGSHGDGH